MEKRKYRVFAAIVAFMIALTLCVTFAFGCGDEKEPEPAPEATVTSITLDTSAVKTTFEFGETFSSAGLKVTAKMSDDSTKDIPLADCRINPPNMQQPGEQNVVVTHTASRKNAAYKVTVGQRPIDETPLLEIKGENAEKAYRVEAESINMAKTEAKSTAEDGSFVVSFEAEGAASGNAALTNYGVAGNFFAYVFTSDKAYTGASLAIAVANRGAGVTPIQNNLTVSLNEKELELKGGITPNQASYVWREVFAQGLDIKEGRNTVYFNVTGTGLFSLDYIDLYVGKTPEIPENKSYVKITEATTYVQEAEGDLNLFDFVPQAGFSEPNVESSVLASGGKSIGGVGANSTFTVGVSAKEQATVRIIARMAKFEGDKVSKWASFTFDGEPVDLGDKTLSAGYGSGNDTKFYNWNDVTVGEFDIEPGKTYDFTFNTPTGAINIDALKFAVLTYGAFASADEKSAPTPNAYIAETGKTVVEAESLDASTWKNTDGAGYGEHSAASGGKSIGHLADGSVINVNIKLSDKATVLVGGYMAKYEEDYILTDNVTATFAGKDIALPEVTFGHADNEANPFHNWRQIGLGRYDLDPGIYTLALTVKEGANSPNIDCFEFTTLSYGAFTKAEISGIKIAAQPNTRSYYEGEAFDPAGMKVMLMGTGDKELFEVTKDVRLAPNGPLTADVKKVTASYGEYTAEIDIEVEAVADIEITAQPTKTVYNDCDQFDAAGMVISGIFADGEKRDITSLVTYDKIVTPGGINVTYAGKTVQPAITVNEDSILVREVNITENTTYTVKGTEIAREGLLGRGDQGIPDGGVKFESTGIVGFRPGSTFTLKIKTNGKAKIAFGTRMCQGSAPADDKTTGSVAGTAGFTFNGAALTAANDELPAYGPSNWHPWTNVDLGSVTVEAGEYTFVCTTAANFALENFTFTVTDYAA